MTESHIVCSEDTVHDPSAVIHFNGKILLPWLIQNIKDLRNVHMTTDGAPTQYMHADLYYWIARCKAQYGVRMDWVIGAAAHSKDLSDSECGGAKHSVDSVNLAHKASDGARGTRISTVAEAIAHLRTPWPVGYGTPKKDIFKKRGKGIRVRYFYHVKLKQITRRITHCDNFEGSKKMHQFLDIGEEGKLLVRPRPCHYCPGCMSLDKEAIMNDCKHQDRCGQAKIVVIKPKSGARAVIADDNNAIWTEGRRLSALAKAGDFVAVELTFDNLPWLIGEVVGDDPYYEYKEEAKHVYMGKLQPGDRVLRVRRWLPLHCGGGSSMFEEVGGDDGVILAFAQDVRCRIAKEDASKEFRLARKRTLAPRVDNVKAAEGAKFKYMFQDRPGEWFEGTIDKMNRDGVTALATFNDGDHWTHLIVWGDLKGGRIEILSGGEHVHKPSHTAPQRRLLPDTRQFIQAAVC